MKNKKLEVKVDKNTRTYSMKFEIGQDKFMISTTLKYKGNILDLDENEKIVYTCYKCNKEVAKDYEDVERYEKISEIEDDRRPYDKSFWTDNHNFWFLETLKELCMNFSLENKYFEVSDEEVYIIEIDYDNCIAERKVGKKIKNKFPYADLSVYFEDGTVGIYNIETNTKSFTHKNLKTHVDCIITDTQEELDVRINNFKRVYIDYDQNRISEKYKDIESYKEHIKQLENL